MCACPPVLVLSVCSACAAQRALQPLPPPLVPARSKPGLPARRPPPLPQLQAEMAAAKREMMRGAPPDAAALAAAAVMGSPLGGRSTASARLDKAVRQQQLASKWRGGMVPVVRFLNGRELAIGPNVFTAELAGVGTCMVRGRRGGWRGLGPCGAERLRRASTARWLPCLHLPLPAPCLPQRTQIPLKLGWALTIHKCQVGRGCCSPVAAGRPSPHRALRASA